MTIDGASERYKDKIEQGIIKPGEPFYRYASGKSIDALSSATEMYFAERGLLFSYVEGKRYNTTFTSERMVGMHPSEQNNHPAVLRKPLQKPSLLIWEPERTSKEERCIGTRTSKSSQENSFILNNFYQPFKIFVLCHQKCQEESF